MSKHAVLALLLATLAALPLAQAQTRSAARPVPNKAKAASAGKKLKSAQQRALQSTTVLYRKSLEFNPKLSAQAAQGIQKIERQLRGIRTVGEWMDRAPKQAKLRRRMNFANLTKTSLPSFVAKGHTLVFKFGDKKAKAHLFTLFPEKRGIVTLLNGVDISPLPKESFEKWSQRVGGVKQAQRLPFKNLFISPAYAQQQGGFNEFRFATMLRLMSNEDWENFDLAEAERAGILVSPQEARSLNAEMDFLAQNHNLRCERDGIARLSGQLGGRPVELMAYARRNPNDSSFTVEIQSGGSHRGQLNIGGQGQSASLALNGRTYANEAFVPALYFSVQGGDMNRLPENSPARGPQPVTPAEMVGALEATRACQALRDAGVTHCDQHMGDSIALSNCARELLSARLPGGLFNRTPLRSLEPQVALGLKARLIAIYQDVGYEFPIGANFPSERTRTGYPAPRFNGQNLLAGDQLMEAIGQDFDEQNPAHQDLLSCARQSGNGSSCNSRAVIDLIGEDRWAFQRAFQNMNLAHRVYDFNRDLGDAAASQDTCSQSFIDNNMLIAAENYERLSLINSNESAIAQVEAELGALMSAVDAARAICGNQQMRNNLQGTGSPVRSSN